MKNLPNSVLKALNEKAIADLKALKARIEGPDRDFDEELGHKAADEVLTNLLEELGFYDLVAGYDEINKWFA